MDSLNSKKAVIDSYKFLQFYIAFENTLMNDYATEKLYGAFLVDIVPVYWYEVLQFYEFAFF